MSDGFLPLKTRPDTHKDNFWLWAINARRWLQRIQPMSAAQYRFERTLLERSVTARRVFFVIQTSGDTAIRVLTEHVNVWQIEAEKPTVTENDVIQAIEELIEHGLLSQTRRPRMRYNLID